MLTDEDIKKRNLLFHPHCLELSTGRREDKYKLVVFMLKQIDLYLLIWGTSQSYLKDKDDTLTVFGTDWAYINTSFSSINNTGYYSWSHIVHHTKREITSNCTELVATMKLEVFKNLLEKNSSGEKFVGLEEPMRNKLAQIATRENNEAIDLAERFGLA